VGQNRNEFCPKLSPIFQPYISASEKNMTRKITPFNTVQKIQTLDLSLQCKKNSDKNKIQVHSFKNNIRSEEKLCDMF
jgi:hypothetical protein